MPASKVVTDAKAAREVIQRQMVSNSLRFARRNCLDAAKVADRLDDMVLHEQVMFAITVVESACDTAKRHSEDAS